MRDLGIVLCLASVLAGCGGGEATDAPTSQRKPGAKLRLYHDPYRDVDWAKDARLKGQHHDHLMANLTGRIRAYDAAGYDAVSLMDYSGAPSIPYALKTRLWPPESIVPGDVLAKLQSVRFFIPNGEEVGLSSSHYTSPFLKEYVEYSDAAGGAPAQPWQYANPAGLAQVVTSRGGLLIAAHPWDPERDFSKEPFLFGVEIYSAFAEFKKRQGDPAYTGTDRNKVLLRNWDRALSKNHALVGLAVNDHFGPYLTSGTSNDDIRDSGKVIVLSPTISLEGYEEAFRRRAVLAVKDAGTVKDRFPAVRSITKDENTIRIDTDDQVRWLLEGRLVGNGAQLSFSQLPITARYLRAEIENAEGSIVYTQAWSVRLVGDANGDDNVDSADTEICRQVLAGHSQNPDHIAACHAIDD